MAKRYDLTKRVEEVLERLAAKHEQPANRVASLHLGGHGENPRAQHLYAKLGIKGHSDLASFLEQELSDSLDRVSHRFAGREREGVSL